MSLSRDRRTAVLAAGGAALVVLLAVLVVNGLARPVDAALIRAVRDPSLHGLLTPLGQITELGSTWAVTAVALATAALAIAIGPWRHGVIGALTILLASILNATLKVAIARERPELLEPLVDERGFAFPSGHTTLGTVAYGILAVVIGRSRLPRPVRTALVVGLVVLIGLIGVSRVWLGVHFPTDVLAGWITGGVIVLLYRWVTRSVPREAAEVALDDEHSPVSSDR